MRKPRLFAWHVLLRGALQKVSDLFYSTGLLQSAAVEAAYNQIYGQDAPEVHFYCGEWGSLAIGRSHYGGYQPYEDAQHLCVVIGGPVLNFTENHFFSQRESSEGARAILTRWRAGVMRWDEDLSGPFVVCIVDKVNRRVECVTDLMLFIPVYLHQGNRELMLGTHVDALASLCNLQGRFDEISLADFILHGAVTYPYTTYADIRQMGVAAVHRIHCEENQPKCSVETYWRPEEVNAFASLTEAADVLRAGVRDYLQRATASMDQVAQFISGGEDSRALSGLLPSRLQRDAYIFLDAMNREGEIAQRAAAAYGARFHADLRDALHYLSILPQATDLIGSHQEYRHAHTWGFHRRWKLDGYSAVFGGCFSDLLLKGMLARQSRLNERFDFLPEVFLPGETHSREVKHDLFSGAVLAALTERRRAHLRRVTQVRPVSAQEWFFLWPMTMRPASANLSCNRRLFASFEPFASSSVVKISAAVPVGWKLNRRLFNRAFRPYLHTTRWLSHADGRLPYFPWWVNCPIRFTTWFYRWLSRRVGGDTRNQGAWCDWRELTRHPEWQQALTAYWAGSHGGEIGAAIERGAFDPDRLTTVQRVNLTQVCYWLGRKTHSSGNAAEHPSLKRAAVE
jgi:asparagine synthetase B (glutamine-hydrolysing)